MLWYVLQTRTGKEEKLAGLIQAVVPRHLYGECFVIYQEQLWRRRQENFVHVKRAFPGYVFITSKDPEALFFFLKQIPVRSKMMADDDFFFLAVEREESEFLKKIMDKDHVIGLSYLSTDGKGNIRHVSGPLKACKSQIVRCRFGKRNVLVRLKLLGEEKLVLLGIVLNDDICQELRYGKVEAPILVPERYRIIENAVRCHVDDVLGILPGDKVIVMEGAFEGMSGIVYQKKDNIVKMGIHLFGQDMEIEMMIETLRKLS